MGFRHNVSLVVPPASTLVADTPCEFRLPRYVFLALRDYCTEQQATPSMLTVGLSGNGWIAGSTK